MFAFISAQNIEDFRPERCISTIYHCKDIPFWSETLDIRMYRLNVCFKPVTFMGDAHSDLRFFVSGTCFDLGVILK